MSELRSFSCSNLRQKNSIKQDFQISKSQSVFEIRVKFFTIFYLTFPFENKPYNRLDLSNPLRSLPPLNFSQKPLFKPSLNVFQLRMKSKKSCNLHRQEIIFTIDIINLTHILNIVVSILTILLTVLDIPLVIICQP